MWLVVSIKNLNIFKEDLKKTYPDIDIYFPKIITKNKKKKLKIYWVIIFFVIVQNFFEI